MAQSQKAAVQDTAAFRIPEQILYTAQPFRPRHWTFPQIYDRINRQAGYKEHYRNTNSVGSTPPE
jgi:hypothetical protein